MKIISLKEFSPIISDKQSGDKIYRMIKNFNPDSAVVGVDMGGIKSMATFCAKQIFGRLYLELTPAVFYSNVKIINASEDVKLIIKLGIQSAVNES